jgi:hypothetical protein
MANPLVSIDEGVIADQGEPMAAACSTSVG